MARRGRDNFRFTTVELSALALSFTATSVLVFLLGFYVGRRVAAEHIPVGDNVARVPVGTPPSDDTPARQPAPRPAAAAPSTSQLSSPPAPATAAAPKTAPTGSAQASPKPLTPSAAATQPASQPTTSPTVRPATTAVPVPAPVSPPALVQAPPGVPYTVQVLATRNKNEAETLTNNLKRKGLGAYLVQVDDAGGSWYRVRIGNYDSPDAARRTADRASKELGLTQAYVIPLTSGSR